MKTKFSRSIAKWTNEQDALTDVCTAQNVPANQLTAAHTPTHFVWEANLLTTPPGKYAIAKSETTEDQATQQALLDLETFEGNLQSEHTETHFVFSKIR